MLWLKPRPFVQSSFDMQAPRWPHVLISASFFPFVYLEMMSVFPSSFVPFPLSFCMESTSVRFSLPNGVYLPCDHGLDFLHQRSM